VAAADLHGPPPSSTPEARRPWAGAPSLACPANRCGKGREVGARSGRSENIDVLIVDTADASMSTMT